MGDEAELELLLSFDGANYEAAEGYVVEFTLVFRPARGAPYVRFDNAHAAERPGGRFVKASPAYDHWHRDERDLGRPYKFTTASQLLDDFWSEIKRVMKEKGIPNDL
jgi:hypothetical protein